MRTEHIEVRATDSLFSRARVAVIVGKHGHTIVDRNRLRRRLRELARTILLPAFDARSADIVVRALPDAYGASFDDLGRQMKEATDRLSPRASE